MKIQIDDQVRNATQNEIAHIEKIQADAKEYEQYLANLSAAKQTAKNKLRALGLSEEEIAALVG